MVRLFFKEAATLAFRRRHGCDFLNWRCKYRRQWRYFRPNNHVSFVFFHGISYHSFDDLNKEIKSKKNSLINFQVLMKVLI